MMRMTYENQFRAIARKARPHIDIDLVICDGERERCQRERANRRGNGHSQAKARLPLIPAAIKAADRDADICDDPARWMRFYRWRLWQLVEASKPSKALGNGNGAAHNGAQNVELNGCLVSGSRNTIDATATAIPLW